MKVMRSRCNLRMAVLTTVLSTTLAATSFAASTATPKTARTGPDSLFGQYLACRAAQQARDFSIAADWYEKALSADTDAAELISRTFLTELCAGHFDRARALAPKVLKIDPSDAIAQLALIVDRIKANDAAGAAKMAASPSRSAI